MRKDFVMIVILWSIVTIPSGLTVGWSGPTMSRDASDRIALDPAVPVAGEELNVTLVTGIDPTSARLCWGTDGFSFKVDWMQKLGPFRFSHLFVVPSDAVTLYYFYYLYNGTTTVNISETYAVQVIETEPPVIHLDHTDRMVVAGTEVVLSLDITDNRGMGSASVDYSFDGGPRTSLPLSGYPYSARIDVPFGPKEMEYQVTATDVSGNVVVGDPTFVSIFSFPYDEIYGSGMGSDPGWMTDREDRFYWNGSTYHLSGGSGYSGAQVPALNRSFVLVYDLRIDALADGGMLVFGLRSPSMTGTGELIEMLLAGDGAVDHAELRVIDKGKTLRTGMGDLEIGTGPWYRFRIVYDAYSGSARGDIVEISSGRTCLSVRVAGIEGFSELSRLCSSYRDMAPSGISYGELDEVHLYQEAGSDLIVQDLTQGPARTGDPFVVSASLVNMSRVCSAMAEHSFDDGPVLRMNLTLNTSADAVLEVPADSYYFDYRISVADPYGVREATAWKRIEVMDDDPPEVVEDRTSDRAYAGWNMLISVLIGDNREVEGAFVTYWADEGERTTAELLGAGKYEASVVVPYGGTFHYQVYALDGAGNNGSGPVNSIGVQDGTPPYIVEDQSDASGAIGEVFRFEVEAADDNGELTVRAGYDYGGEERYWTDLEPDGTTWTAAITVPYSLAQVLNYTIEVKDASGNTVLSGPKAVPIENPIVEGLPGTPLTLYEGVGMEALLGLPFGFNVSSMSWTQNGLAGNGTLTSEGRYVCEIVITDRIGLTLLFRAQITYYLADHDADGDGIPDVVETGSHLDPNDPSDARLDRDKDGLTNVQEYWYGTDIGNPDSDGDGIPDGWEVKYSLDPLRFSALEDADGDGRTDLEEYRMRSDPRGHEDDGLEGIYLTLTAAVLVTTAIVLLIVLVLVLSMKLGRAYRRIRSLEGPAEKGGSNGSNAVSKRKGAKDHGFVDPMDPLIQGVSLANGVSEDIPKEETVQKSGILKNGKLTKKHPMY